jgi:hypothetical protein
LTQAEGKEGEKDWEAWLVNFPFGEFKYKLQMVVKDDTSYEFSDVQMGHFTTPCCVPEILQPYRELLVVASGER